ncbi:MAG: aminotransferase class III-fold pyridoxal phosphate-dependent enzyme [Bacteroidota bacterium]|nr:aminotransferase class III-fold pyridoxal phosphate-dependent enzyme [Bacteroidota bacterium]
MRKQFLSKIAQTSEIPSLFQIKRASGVYLWDMSDQKYLDFHSGFSVNNIGHSNPRVLKGIELQAANYLHSSVYGDHIQSPQIKLAHELCNLLPPSLNAVYFLNSGSEAVDTAVKLAKKITGKGEVIACNNAYHGSTMLPESLRSDREHNRSIRPLMPGVRFIEFNEIKELDKINSETACVIIEPIQAEAGIRLPSDTYLKALSARCQEVGCLLLFDEIQTGFGRTGQLFAFQNYDCIPDILICGKALGAGLPLSALIAERSLLAHFENNPALSHLSTFGGNPLCCAAALEGLKVLLDERCIENSVKNASLIVDKMQHPMIKDIRFSGLFMAVQFETEKVCWNVMRELYEEKILVESFLFCPSALRVSPPLIVNEKECLYFVEILLKILNERM